MKKGMRLILNRSYDTPSNQMYVELKWFPLKFRYKHKICQLVYKGLHNLAPPYINDLVHYYQPKTGMLLRSVARKDLNVPYAKKKIYRRCFSINGPNSYNELPKHVRDSKTFKAFQSSSHLHFYQEYIKSI